MKSQIAKILVKLKPRPKELLGVGIAVIGFFAIALFVNGFRSEPLKIFGSEARIGQGKDKHVKKTEKWTYCGANEVDSFVKEGRAIIIDARPGLFYKMGHIPSALSLPAATKELGSEVRKILSSVPVSRAIVVYCTDKNCENAETVAEQISLMGYGNIYIFLGGWAEWTKTKRKIEK